MKDFSRGDRVMDRISDDTGTVKDQFMNQIIVRWDTPDESGNRTSSVPAADLVDEEAATELHLDDGQEIHLGADSTSIVTDYCGHMPGVQQ